MKKIIVTIFLSFLFPFGYAQRFLGSSNLNASFKLGNAIGGKFEFEKLVSPDISIFGSVDFLNSKELIKVSSGVFKPSFNNVFFTVGGRYFLSTYSRILPYVEIGGVGGYTFFLNKDQLPKSIAYKKGEKYLYGGSGGGGLEYNFGTSSLCLSCIAVYDFSQQRLFVTGGIGIKFYIF